MPLSNKKLMKVLDYKKVYVVALIIDPETGAVINGGKALVVGGETGISTVGTAANATVVARYAADGTMISAPQKGLNILKMSDGTISGFTAVTGKKYKVWYFIKKLSALCGAINSSMVGRVVLFTTQMAAYTNVNANTKEGTRWGWLYTHHLLRCSAPRWYRWAG